MKNIFTCICLLQKIIIKGRFIIFIGIFQCIIYSFEIVTPFECTFNYQDGTQICFADQVTSNVSAGHHGHTITCNSTVTVVTPHQTLSAKKELCVNRPIYAEKYQAEFNVLEGTNQESHWTCN